MGFDLTLPDSQDPNELVNLLTETKCTVTIKQNNENKQITNHNSEIKDLPQQTIAPLFNNEEEAESVLRQINGVEENLNKVISLDYLTNIRKALTEQINKISEDPLQNEYLTAIANYRKIDVDVLKQAKSFFVPDTDYLMRFIPTTLFKDKDYGWISGRYEIPIFRKRWVIPCFDQKHLVSGLVGYDNLHHLKYLLNTTIGFTKKNITFGYEDLDNILKSGYCILVEGIFDWLRLRSMGLSVICLQGTFVYPNLLFFLSKLPLIITILDNDTAGRKAIPFIRYAFPKTTRVVDILLDKQEYEKMDADKFFINEKNKETFIKFIHKLLNNEVLYINDFYFKYEGDVLYEL